MDIEYLLFLQRLREMTNDILTPFMEWISLFAVSYLVFIPCLIYWIYDKRKGLFPLATYFLCVGINAVVKLTACVYRPWIRDPRVVPAGDSIKTATGYSFPSGHTASAGPLYGGMARVFHDSKKWISWICMILVLITGFSRNYLGVHTPQDVVVAMLESLACIYVMHKIFPYVEKNPEKEDILLLFEFLFAVAALVYVTYKPYPMEYIDGVLIVDPEKMMNDGYGDLAVMMTYPIARYIEKRWVKFEPVGLNMSGLIAGVLGFIPFYAIRTYLRPYLIAQFGSHWGKLFANSALVFYWILIFPIIIKLFFNKKETEEKQEEE